MPGSFERLHSQTNSHQFINPLDDIHEIAQASSISVENLLSDFHIVSNPRDSNIDFPSCSEGVLVDLTNSDSRISDGGLKFYDYKLSSSLRSDYVTALLMKDVVGVVFDRRNGQLATPRMVQLISGMLMRTMDDEDVKKDQLESWYRSRYDRQTSHMAAPMMELVNGSVCAMVTSSDVMRISHEQALQLLSVSETDRIELYNDFERLNFLTGLKVGQRVLVDVNDEMRRVPAHVSWIGEREDQNGIWYTVDFDTDSQWPHLSHERLNRRGFESNSSSFSGMSGGSSSVAPANSRIYFSPNHLHMPLKGGGVPTLYDNRRPVPLSHEDDYRISGTAGKPVPRERNIPVKIKAATPEPMTRQSRSMRTPEDEHVQQYGYGNHNDNAPPSYSSTSYSQHHQQQQHQQQQQQHQQPSRSRSVHSIPIALKRQQDAARNEPIGDDHLGIRVGDPCVWNNNGVNERGIVKFIGYLKGHRALYAGVEFKNRIGAGTGIFNKEQLFQAKDGHAGFVELSTLEPTSSSSSSTSTSSSTFSNGAAAQYAHRRRLSSSRSQQIPASAGPTVSVPVTNGRSSNKQASVESLSDPPPPAYTPPSPPRSSSAASSQQAPPLPPKPMSRVEDYLISPYAIGSFVIVSHLGAERTGIVRWLGDAMNEEGNGLERSAVVQIDEDVPTAWRRSCEVQDYTGTPVIGGVIVPASALRSNRAVATIPSSNSSYLHNYHNSSNAPSYSSTSANGSGGTMSRRNGEFGSIDSGVEKQKCGPAKDSQVLIGRQKGIQGYRNSCYIDATLYAMFVQTTVFDFLLEKSVKGKDKAAQFQKLLAQEIVFPLRKFHYVRADHVMKLRELLQDLMPHMTGLTNEEKDPEEILAFIFSEIFHAEPFIKLIGQNNAVDSQYLVPIVIDSDWQGGAATSQHLLERHMKSAQVKFVKPPPVLIMQLPRYGQQKVFDKILPLEKIDITPFVAGAAPGCSLCDACADLCCPTCFLTRRVFYTDIVYCERCFKRSHDLPELADHVPTLLFGKGGKPKKTNSHKMVLSAVLCIETSHYVAYVRTPSGQWVFFDSMADREGLSDGFNVPVVRECPEASNWLTLDGWQRLKDADDTGQIKAMFGKSGIDPLVARLLSDSYICFYEDASNYGSNGGSSALLNTFKSIIG